MGSVQDPQADIRVVAPERWDDLVTLFERPGPRGGRQDVGNCWCAIWRGPSRSPEENKQQLCDVVAAGDEPGLLAYRDGEPVGWVSVAAREHFPGLLRSTQFRPRDDDAGVHVITCFHVDRRERGQGVAGSLLDAAVRHALARGASAVEAYPSEPSDYKGRLGWFLDYGFVPVREAGKRTVVRFTPE